jgi:hypothetical protein
MIKPQETAGRQEPKTSPMAAKRMFSCWDDRRFITVFSVIATAK